MNVVECRFDFRIDRLPVFCLSFFRCLAGGRIRIPNSLPSQERSGCLGRELQRLVRTLLRCVLPENSNAIIGVVTTGFECLPPSCDGLTGSEDHGPMISPVDTPCVDLPVTKLDRVECQLVDPRFLKSQYTFIMY
ncbi:serine/threonine-protein kinase ATM [Dorcoceras hygrometricum]|uniref:Serine/threonine-protein kinase ATM n=1 Tax=Dorcoceras hygrometricum TaxID=472368 RepID=A0A2Z7C6M2_9LAMI|nr:serine/threonine-protein kinase ATM [Dorcoceras hygrometricum]